MDKKEIKKILRVYPYIKKDIEDGKEFSIYKRNGKKYKINIPKWAYCINSLISRILENEKDDIVSKIIIQDYIKGYKDKKIISNYPITESGYYRIKRKFEEKLYELYVLLGYVSEKEILNNEV